MVLGQVQVDPKSNEITALPELLSMLAVAGCMVTLDALGCRREIAARIVDKEADYVLAVKANQGTLYEDMVRYFEWAFKDQFEQTTYSRHERMDGEHGRLEVRRYSATSAIEWLSQKANWKGLQSIAMVESERTILGEATSRERRYYISSLAADAPRLGGAMRGHWSSENSLYWV